MCLVEGSFLISGGTVYGNDAGPTLSNFSYGDGATLSAFESTAQYGTFDGTNWSGLTDIPVTTSGYEYYKDETIKVVNGTLITQP